MNTRRVRSILSMDLERRTRLGPSRSGSPAMRAEVQLSALHRFRRLEGVGNV
jgi:hypothetical protein